jgi:hypothetical protein
MKKWLFLITAVFLLAACQVEKERAVNKSNEIVKNETKNNEIKISYRSIKNGERIYDFTKKVIKHQKDQIRITQNTIEGDPIYQDIEYDGKDFQYTLDTREDDYGTKEVITKTCSKFRVEEKNTEATAILDQCENGQTIELYTLEYNSALEDRFDFALKYGENLEKVIDTNRTPMENKEKNIVFKNLVYINFLRMKFVNEPCSDSKMKYDLTVWLNGGKEHFKWSDCDKGKDAENLNGVAQTIIKVYETQ